jgi:hypothetical protein
MRRICQYIEATFLSKQNHVHARRLHCNSLHLRLAQAWDVRYRCKHNGVVLPLPSAPEGRGADGVDAMA